VPNEPPASHRSKTHGRASTPLPETVVPAFLRLISERLPSGRYRAADLFPTANGDGAAADPVPSRAHE
jgi:hypothetical protein